MSTLPDMRPLHYLCYVLASLATATGLIFTLMMLGLMLAGMANMKPAEEQRMKIALLCVAVGGLLFAGAAIWLLVKGHTGWSALVGGFPAVAVVTCLIYVSAR